MGLSLKLGGLGVPLGSKVALSAIVTSLVQVVSLWEILTNDFLSSSKCGVSLEE